MIQLQHWYSVKIHKMSELKLDWSKPRDREGEKETDRDRQTEMETEKEIARLFCMVEL